MKEQIEYSAFQAVDVRTGTIVGVEPFPQARVPAYKLAIDFGDEIGTKQSSAQITTLYSPETLLGKQVVAVVNFAPKRIAGFASEVLVLGVPDSEGRVVLLAPDRSVVNGVPMF